MASIVDKEQKAYNVRFSDFSDYGLPLAHETVGTWERTISARSVVEAVLLGCIHAENNVRQVSCFEMYPDVEVVGVSVGDGSWTVHIDFENMAGPVVMVGNDGRIVSSRERPW